jgi:hypothetical protein
MLGDEIILKEAELWGNLVARGTLFFYVTLIDSIPVLRSWVQGALYLFNGKW